MKKTTNIILAAIIALLLCASFALGMYEGFLNFGIFATEPSDISDTTDTNPSDNIDLLKDEDKFVGFFLTTKQIKFEEISDEDLKNYLKAVIEDEDAEFTYTEKRLYAETTPGENNTFERITFPGLKGVLALEYISEYSEGSPVSCSYGDTYDNNYKINIGDDCNEHILEGTIFVFRNATYENLVDYCYPVYQTNSGAFYLTEHYLVELERIGDSYITQSRSTTYKRWINNPFTGTSENEEATLKSTVTVFIKVVDQYTSKLIVKEMDKDDAVLTVSEFDISALPEEYAVREDTAYLLLERELVNEDETLTLKREIVTPDGETPLFYLPDEQGYGIRKNLIVDWGFEEPEVEPE